MAASLPNIAERNTWSYAPIPSTVRIVAFGFASVAARSRCPTQSVPARVDKAYWNGAHSASNTFMNCLASVLATSRRTVQPVAIPLTPPFGFVSAVNRAPINAVPITGGTLPCASRLHVANNSSCESVSSNINFRCSYVQPPGPADDPRGALRKLSKNVFRSWSTGRSGTNSRTSRGNSLRCTWGRLSCNSRKMSSVPGATEAPVRHWRALETSPMRTFWHAILTFFSAVGASTGCERLGMASLIASWCNSSHWPPMNKSKRWDNSAFPTRPRLSTLRNNQKGNTMKSFQPRISLATSFCCTAVCTASRAVVRACRYLAFKCAEQPCRIANLCLKTSCKQTSEQSKICWKNTILFTIRERGNPLREDNRVPHSCQAWSRQKCFWTVMTFLL